MGLAVGVNPTTRETDYMLLTRQVGPGESYRVKIRGEGGKFNINAILQQAESGDTLLEDIFSQWLSGVVDGDPEKTEREFRDLSSEIVDALRDWVDPDDLSSLNGAENDYYLELGYENYPFNRPFYSLDEVLLVRGMD